MFAWLGLLTTRFRYWVLGAAGLFLVFAGVWGTGVFGALSPAGFDDPGSESFAAAERIADEVGRQDADVLVVYRSDTATVDDPAFRDAVEDTLAALPDDAVAAVTSYYSTQAPPLVSEDRRATLVVLQLTGADGEDRAEAYDTVRDELAAGGLTHRVGGIEAVNDDVNGQVGADIARAEAISAPILLVLLVLIFGSLVAAQLPLLVGAISILGAFTALRVVSLVGDVSIFAVNVITILGLGLAIDYALFVVSRFREELGRGHDPHTAVIRTLATAGRTVAVSGLIVAISLSGLLLFPQLFLRSMGYGGIAAVLIAMIASLTVLPALLAVLGTRVDALRIPLPWNRRRGSAAPAASAASARGGSEGAWARIARSVMRRPVIYLVGVVALLLALGTPFLRAEFGGIDERALPADTPSRVVAETVDRDFPGAAGDSVDVLVSGADATQVQPWLTELTAVEGVDGAEISATRDDSTLVSVDVGGDAGSADARATVELLRTLDGPGGAEVLVGGFTAQLVDLLAGLGGILPWMALLVAVTTFVLLFLAFGSVLLPIKAILANVLSLTASFGALVWIFQDGNLAGVLGFTPTGTIDATQPILMLAILFGLSMDYEVFLLSRIREQWDLTGDNTAAVAIGLQRTGGIITSAALLLLVVIGSFSTSGITFIKMIGVGMAIAIVIDATVVRLFLVPAAMRLLGSANWWAPGPLRRLWERYGLRESDGEPAAAVAPAAAPSLVKV